MAGIIESRALAGQYDAVRGWHNLLKNLLGRMAQTLSIWEYDLRPKAAAQIDISHTSQADCFYQKPI